MSLRRLQRHAVAAHSPWSSCVFAKDSRVNVHRGIPMIGKDTANLYKTRKSFPMEHKCSETCNVLSTRPNIASYQVHRPNAIALICRG